MKAHADKLPIRDKIVSGKFVFELKDTNGLPLAMTFIECEAQGAMIDWVGFIEAARAHGWWDYQTLDMISEAFTDSGVWADLRTEIEARLKRYVVLKPHPLL